MPSRAISFVPCAGAIASIALWSTCLSAADSASPSVGMIDGTTESADPSTIQQVSNDSPVLLSAAHEPAEASIRRLQTPRFGYDNGFVIESPPGFKMQGQGFPYSMRINSRFQFRHTAFDSDGPNPDQNDFEFERLRLVFSGHVYTPELKYFFQFDGDNDEAARADFLDYFIRYDLGKHCFGWESGCLGIQVGQWKVPFNRSRAESGYKLQFTDRATANVFFDINRSVGLGLYGAIPATKWTWELALHNGFGNQGFLASRNFELDTNFAVSGRAQADLIGEWGKDGEPDLNPHEAPAFRVGMGFATTRIDSGLREFSRLRVVDSGRLLSLLVPASTESYDVSLFAVDTGLKYRGLSVISEFYFRTITNFVGATVDNLFDHGFVVQAGYFLIPESWEVAARYSRIVGNSGALGAFDASSDEIGLGTTWYMRGHSAKLVFDATHLNGSPAQDSALNIRAGDEGMLYRTQFQLMW